MKSSKQRHTKVPRLQKQTLVHLDAFEKDSKKWMREGQFLHLRDCTMKLDQFGDPHATRELRLDKLSPVLWELKEKGGPLGNLNMRVFFAPLPARNEILVTGAAKKENEDQVKPHLIWKNERRVTYYLQELAG